MKSTGASSSATAVASAAVASAAAAAAGAQVRFPTPLLLLLLGGGGLHAAPAAASPRTVNDEARLLTVSPAAAPSNATRQKLPCFSTTVPRFPDNFISTHAPS